MNTPPPTTPTEAQNPKDAHPLSFDDFMALYQQHLGDPDRPNCYTAYVRAEADAVALHGRRRYANDKTFRNTMSRHNTAAKRNASPIEGGRGAEQRNTGKVPIKCQLCESELYQVPRGDLRTIIPHFCEGCRDEIRKLIFV